MKITKEDSEDIGFVLAALTSQAITMSELREWALNVVQNEVDYPTYVLDLMEFDGPPFKLYELIGFYPDFELSDLENKALYGIAFKRGMDVFEDVPEDMALDALKCSGYVEELFRRNFPFLDLSSN